MGEFLLPSPVIAAPLALFNRTVQTKACKVQHHTQIEVTRKIIPVCRTSRLMDCVKWVGMDGTRFCLPASSVSKKNLLDLRYLQIKSFSLERWNRKQSIIANSQRGLLVSHMSHKYILCQAWPVQFSRLLGFAITKTKRGPHNREVLS